MIFVQEKEEANMLSDTPIKVYRSATLMRKYINTLQYRKEHPEKIQIYDTGFPDLNGILGGGIGKWYVVIVAAQKQGKTILLKHLVKMLSQQGCRVVEVSLEMGEELTAQRMLADAATIPMNRFKNPANLTDREFEVMWEEQSKLQLWDTYHNFSSRTIEKIEALAGALKPDILAVDYLGLAGGERNYRSANERITDISHRMKALTLPPVDSGEETTEELFDRLLLTLNMYKETVGEEATNQMIAWAQDGYEKIKSSSEPDEAENDLIPEATMGLYTAQQTSKEMQRRGELDETSPKDSQAPFEDCDLGMVINSVKGFDDEPLSHLRELKVVVSRISEVGALIVGVNTSLSRMFVDPMYNKTNVQELRI